MIEPEDEFISTNCDGPPPIPYPFNDVPYESYAYEDIRLLAEVEITTGIGPYIFGPFKYVSREQMGAFLARLWRLLDAGETELPDPLPHPFTDVPEDSYAHEDIALLAHLEITTGSTPTTFEPTLTVTREQMAAFLARLWRLLDAGEAELPDPLPHPFTDVPEDSYAHEDIALLAHLEITTGSTPTTFEPTLTVTREQMAAFLARLYRWFAS